MEQSSYFSLSNFFDCTYILNLHKRNDRLSIMKKRLQFVGIHDYEVFGAVDGSNMNFIWSKFYQDNTFFNNPNYLACAISHLSIYREAVEKNHKRILIIEDDCRINRNIHNLLEKQIVNVPDNYDLLYLGYIPLSDDCQRWDYNVFGDKFISSNTFTAKNLWGLYSYSISQELMIELLDTYDKTFPMELDRYFVNHVQPRNKSYGVSPQLFCAEDGLSDNSGIIETSMLERSVDSRFARYTDYI